MITTAATYILIAENKNNSEQKRAGIGHREDCWIQKEKKLQPTIFSLKIDSIRKQLSRSGISVVNFVVKPLHAEV